MEANDLNKSSQEGTNLNSNETFENTNKVLDTTESQEKNTPSEALQTTSKSEEQPEKTSATEPKDAGATSSKSQAPPQEEKTKHEENHHGHQTLPPEEKLKYNGLSKTEMIAHYKHLLSTYPVLLIKDEVEEIKSEFYKIRLKEVESQKAKFIESGEQEENFSPTPDPLEIEIKELIQSFRKRRTDFINKLETEKEKNLQEKYAVVEGIKDLINRQESLNDTFQEFRDLQQKWRDIGPVPQAKLKDLWENYNHHIENFYNYIKINKELRDLDLKKNLEAKIILCEKAEQLLLETSIVQAFKTLQKLHNSWRETGPVPREKKDELWERFKETTSKINKKHQEYFEGLKDQLKKNLEAKTELCEKAENLAEEAPKSPKEWEGKSNELIELQNIWKTIGFAPKKDNNRIYERFRLACDNFFDRKREFFKKYKDNQHNNLQLKTELCLQAEALKDSTDWKKTTDEFIKIQKKWKEVGPVPRKHSDQVWKRFRTACDFFFDNKSNFFSHIDEAQDDNLKLKKELIEEVKAFKPSEDNESTFKQLQEFQKRWSEIGHVPFKEKDNVNQEFRNIINKHFDGLNMDEFHKNVQKYRNKLENIKTTDQQDNKLTHERSKILNKMKQLESDITLWENNIGFFAKSKNSDALIRDFKNKIENSKRNIKLLNEKLDMIDNM